MMHPSLAPIPLILILSAILVRGATHDTGLKVAHVNLGSLTPRTNANLKTFYSSLVAFGASYTDNAHPRPAQYAGSLRNYPPYNAAGGRYSNGQVAVEYMVMQATVPHLTRVNPKSTIALLDYAYGGSQIDNSLTYGTSPATKDQVSQYIADFSSAKPPAIGGGRILHYINTGINPLTQIWTTACASGITPAAKTTASAQITQNVNAIASQMRSLNTPSIAFSFV
ncbi:hypothetical protein P7C70_g1589, partial [Phenoliferia sp. Uapishka_3]